MTALHGTGLDQTGPAATRAPLVVPVVPVVLALAVAVWRGPQLVDDAFITMRYSFHLAHGHGPVFNIGERIEGFSDPLWMLVLAAASLVGLPLPQVALAAGLLAFLGVVVLSTRLAGAVGAGPVAATVAGCLVALSSDLVGSSLNGLETSLFGLGITATILVAARDPLPKAWFVLGLLVVAYSRPEGPLLAVVILVVTYVARRRWTLETRGLPGLALGILALLASTLVARWAYYGELLPMSVLAKRDFDTDPLHSLARAAPDGILYVVRALGWGWLLLVVLTAVYLALRWRPPTPSARVAAALSLVLGAVGVLVTVSNGGDWMPSGRLLVPYLPPLVVLLTVGIETTAPRAVLPGWALLMAGLQPISTITWVPVPDDYDTVGVRLDEALRSDESVTTNALGHLGYAAPSLRLFDVHGLTEPEVAKARQDASVYGKFDAALAGQRADPVIVVNTWRMLVTIVEEADVSYVAVLSPELERSNAWMAVRTDEADRVAAALSRSFDIELVSIDEATEEWDRIAPSGKSDGGGP